MLVVSKSVCQVLVATPYCEWPSRLIKISRIFLLFSSTHANHPVRLLVLGVPFEARMDKRISDSISVNYSKKTYYLNSWIALWHSNSTIAALPEA